MKLTNQDVIAITRATGFIGVSLVKALAERGNEVRVLSRKQTLELPALLGARHFQGDIGLAIPSGFL